MSLHLFKNVFECIISSILTFRNNNSLFYDITRLVVCHSSILSLVLEDQSVIFAAISVATRLK